MLPQEQLGMGQPDQTQHSPMSIREQLAALFPQLSMGKSSAFRPAQAPAPQQPDSPMVAQIPQGQGDVPDGPMNDEDLVSLLNANTAPPQRRPQAPQYDTAAMDALTAQLANPEQGITEGPNARIDDDTRARALAFALRNAQQ